MIITITERIRVVVEACRADGVRVNERNIVDLVLDNIAELKNCDEARAAIRAAGYAVKGVQ